MRKVLACIGALSLAALSACSGSGGNADKTTAKTEVPVFAAASLSNVFTEMEAEFEAENPDLDLVFNIAGSQDLLAQMEAGAPYTVFVSANLDVMDQAQSAALVENSEVFAANTLTMVINEERAGEITSLADLAANPDFTVVRCAVQVPCGGLTDKVLGASGVEISFDTEQNSVTDTLGLVLAGQADAAFVYQTDLYGALNSAENNEVKVAGVEIPEALEFVQQYPIGLATVDGSGATEAQLAGGQKFIDYVKGEDGQTALQNAGFLPGN